MADINVTVGGRAYAMSCRDGEEAHLLRLAAMVEEKAALARQSAPGLTESRQLLFAAIFLADALVEKSMEPAPVASPVVDESATQAMEALADRIDALAQRLAARLAAETPSA